ncbi:hypothetical protein PM082_007332 [Marasmius tenuissimus]|nr:hypothetical protein PM082_007332 [Marasmius tenuissimus]
MLDAWEVRLTRGGCCYKDLTTIWYSSIVKLVEPKEKTYITTDDMSTSTTPHSRGTACNNCRWKCDRQRPICGVCRKSTLPLEDCEYGPIFQADLLEEKISIAETRLQELQNSASGSSMRLHNPYTQSPPWRSELGPVSHSMSTSYPLRNFQTGMTPERRKILLDAFLPSASELGFFLNPVNFTTSFVQGQGSGSLIGAILLFTSILSSKFNLVEPDCLASVMDSMASDSQRLTPQNSDAIISVIQANVLLANYSFLKGKMVEGRYHTNTAVSLILSSGLHRGSRSLLSPARDTVHEGERINAVFTVLALNAAWTAIDDTGSPAIDWHSPDWRVELPWPLEIEQYRMVSSSQLNARGSDTIATFLAGGNGHGSASVSALYTKACILLERASILYRESRTNLSPEKYRLFQSTHHATSSVLSRFNSEICALEVPRSTRDARRLFALHLLTSVAFIRMLYAQGAHSQPQLMSTISSIVRCTRDLRLRDFGIVDPIVAISLKTVGKVLLQVIRNNRSPDAANSLKEILDAMEALGGQGRGTMMENCYLALRGEYDSMFR